MSDKNYYRSKDRDRNRGDGHGYGSEVIYKRFFFVRIFFLNQKGDILKIIIHLSNMFPVKR